MQISDAARVLVNLIGKFGALTVPQIKKIFEGSYATPKPCLTFLCNSNTIKFVDKNIVAAHSNPTYTPEMIASVWVMLDRIKDEDLIKSASLRSASPCDNGIELCYINDSKAIEYVTFINTQSIAKISMIQDTFYTATGVARGSEKKAKRLYIFVTDDEDAMDMIADMELTVPFIVAYIQGDITGGIPSIEYYQL